MTTPVADAPGSPAGMEGLVEVVQRLSLARDLATVQEIVRRAARRLTGADGATFVLKAGDRCFYADEDGIAPLWKGQRFPLSACISGWSMLHRRPAVIEDIYADDRIPHDAYRPTFVKSLVMVPIMELLRGRSLAAELAQRGLSLRRCAAIAARVADVLAAAHRQGILHRDIKPENVFLHHGEAGETVKVVDFGIARFFGGAQPAGDRL